MKDLLPDFRAFGSKIAIFDGRVNQEKKISYRDLEGAIESWRLEFRRSGIVHGDRICILAENSSNWAFAYYAALCEGVIVVPLDIKGTEPEWLKIIHDCKPKTIVVSNTLEINFSSVIRIDQVELKFERELSPVVELSQDATALLIYTSGTTGEPKGVMVPFRSLKFQVETLNRKMGLKSTEVVLSINPLNHLFELTCNLMTSLSIGIEVVFCPSLYPDDIVRLMRTRGVARMTVVPLFLKLLQGAILRKAEARGEKALKAFEKFRSLAGLIPSRRLRRKMFPTLERAFGKNLKEFIVGGAPLDSDVAEFFESIGIAIYQGYGMTEAGPVIAVNNRNHNILGSVGRPLPGTEVRIQPTKPGEKIGEIFVRGPHLMTGYYGREAMTAEVLKDGWLKTGDLGYMDSAGHLYVTGRSKELIVLSGGKKVQPEEVELQLSRSSFIREICILGTPKTDGTFAGIIEVTAVIVPSLGMLEQHKEDAPLIEGLQFEIDRLSQDLAPYKRPSRIHIRKTELPKTPSRKVRRNLVLAEIVSKGPEL